MSPEIQPADPVYRVRFLIAMTVVALAGAVGVLYLDGYLTELHALAAESQPLAAGKALRAGRAVLAVVAAGAAVISLYLARVSWRTLGSGRFPPPGTRVISDTRVRYGRAARRRGRAGLAMAAATLILTAVVVLQANRLLEALLDTDLKPTPYQPGPLR